MFRKIQNKHLPSNEIIYLEFWKLVELLRFMAKTIKDNRFSKLIEIYDNPKYYYLIT